MNIENKEMLKNADALDAISQLKNILHIRILHVIKRGHTISSPPSAEIDLGGKSGAVIIYAEVVPDENAKWKAGYYYIKVNPGERDEVNEERIKRLGLLQDRAPTAVVEVLELAVHKRSLVEMTGSAQQMASASHNVRRLTELLKSHTHLTRRYISGVSEILFEWSKNSTIIFYDLEEIFLAMFDGGRLRQHPTRKIDQRARILFKQLRWKDDAESNIIPVDIERLSNSSQLNFGRASAVPNPIAYVNHPDWWESVRQIPFRVGFSHQDLHSDNIICDLDPQSTDPVLQPDIIDLTDYKPIHTVFWDFLYFEFDLLIRIGQPDRLENRKELWRLVTQLMQSNLDKPLDYDGPFLFQSIWDCIQILRRKVSEHIELFDDMPGRKERYQLAFWVVATGVGLNYMRKSSVSVFCRLLGLFYAAHAFQHIVKFGRLDEIVSNVDTLHIPNWEYLVQKVIPTEVDAYINEVISPDLSANHPIVICLSPDFNPIQEDLLLEAIQSRLAWWLPKNKIEKVNKVTDAMHEYTSISSDLNLSTLVRRLCHAPKSNENKRLLERLNALCEYLPNLTLVTTAWYEPLLPCPNPDQFEHNPVIYICGHTDIPESLCTLQDWDAEPDNAFLQQEYERLRTLLLDNDKNARIIFLGAHPMGEAGWQYIFRSLRDADYINTKAHPVQLPGNIEPYHFAPKDFIALLHETYWGQAVEEHNQSLRWDLDTYKPPSIVHSNLQEEIIHHEARLWIVHDVAWKGKSTFLKMLSKQHAKWYPSKDIRKGLLIDYNRYPNLRAQKRANIALLLDHYHVDFPEYNEHLRLNDDEKLSQMLEALLSAEVFQHYFNKLLLCFDGLAQDDPYLLDWLRQDIAPQLAEKGVRVVFALRTFDSYANDSMKRMNLTKWQEAYQFRSLEWIQPRDVKTLLLDYVHNVNWDLQTRDKLCKNLESWTYRQALNYQNLGRGRMMIVDKLFREHMADENLDLGNWPHESRWQDIEENVVFKTLWESIKTELGLEMLRDALSPHWQGENDLTKLIVMKDDKLERFYRELLMCRRISGEFIYRWSSYRHIPLPKFLPTMLSELQRLAYIQYDDRPLRLGASRAACRHPIYFVSDTIYTAMQRAFYYQECQEASAEEIEKSMLFQLMKMAYFYFKELAEQAEAHALGDLLVSYAVDVIYSASVLYALDRDAAKPKAELLSYIEKLAKLEVAPDKLRAELETIHISWQINEVQTVLKRLFELL